MGVYLAAGAAGREPLLSRQGRRWCENPAGLRRVSPAAPLCDLEVLVVAAHAARGGTCEEGKGHGAAGNAKPVVPGVLGPVRVQGVQFKDHEAADAGATEDERDDGEGHHRTLLVAAHADEGEKSHEAPEDQARNGAVALAKRGVGDPGEVQQVDVDAFDRLVADVAARAPGVDSVAALLGPVGGGRGG